jgi:hypothetical protein
MSVVSTVSSSVRWSVRQFRRQYVSRQYGFVLSTIVAPSWLHPWAPSLGSIPRLHPWAPSLGSIPGLHPWARPKKTANRDTFLMATCQQREVDELMKIKNHEIRTRAMSARTLRRHMHTCTPALPMSRLEVGQKLQFEAKRDYPLRRQHRRLLQTVGSGTKASW